MAAKRSKSRRRRRPDSATKKPTLATFALVPVELATRHPDKRKQQALEGFMEIGTVSGGCAAAGMSRQAWYEWARTDPLFSRLVIEAKEQLVDQLESAARLRATDTEKGSDFLLKFLLQSYRKDVFAEKHSIDRLHPEVELRLAKMQDLIASRAHWDIPAVDLMQLMSNIWST